MATHNLTPHRSLGPVSDSVADILNQTRVYFCEKCDKLQAVPGSQLGCPGCGDVLDLDNPETCQFSDWRTKRECGELATHVEEITSPGPTLRSFSETHDQPRCAKH